MLCFCPGLVGPSVGKRKSTSTVEAQLPGLWGPWRPALSPWTPKVGREQEEGSGGGAGLGALWDRGIQPEAFGAHPVPGAQGRNLKASALAQSSLTRPAGRGLAARSGNPRPSSWAGLPQGSRRLDWQESRGRTDRGRKEKVPGHPCGVPPTPAEPRPL